MYTVIESLTKTGATAASITRSPASMCRGLLDGGIDAIKPGEDEIVFRRTSSSVFMSTNIDYVLRNLGTRYTRHQRRRYRQCVESAVRDACDLGYLVTVDHGRCATYTRERHDIR